MTEITVRRLGETDVEAWRDLRLEALEHHPEAFGSHLVSEAAQPLGFFAERIAHGPIWGAFSGLEMVGSVGFFVCDGAKRKHKGVLWGLYVREAVRGSAAAGALVEAVLAHARETVEVVQLSVAADNRRACRFYDRMGFLAYGLERHALKVGGRYYDEELRACFLT